MNPAPLFHMESVTSLFETIEDAVRFYAEFFMAPRAFGCAPRIR